MVALDVCLTLLDDDSVQAGIEHAADLDVEAVEFYDWSDLDRAAIRETTAKHDVTLASTLATGAGANNGYLDEPAITDPTVHDDAVADIERSLEAAAELEARNLIVTVGPDQPAYDDRTQRRAIVDVLSAVAPTAESTGVTIVVEPLNVAVDHPGYFLTDSDEAFEIVERVDSPNVTVLYDIYHQQITEGNLVETIEENVDLIGHFHFADVPGRHEPGTGEINFETVFRAIDETGYDGYVGAEFSPLGDPDDVVRTLQDLAETA
jgi:hydroxypyruvate isomerase